MYKMIFEGLIQHLKMFDVDYLNIIVCAIIIYITYPYGWKIVSKINKIKSNDIKSLIHWAVRLLAGYIIFWTIKIPLVLCITLHNQLLSAFLIDSLLYFIFCSIRFSYLERKKNCSYNRFKKIKT